MWHNAPTALPLVTAGYYERVITCYLLQSIKNHMYNGQALKVPYHVISVVFPLIGER